MGTETIDIVVREQGSQTAAAGIRSVGTAAEVSSVGVGVFQSSLDLLKTSLGVLGIGLTIKELFGLSEAYIEVQNRLKLVSADTNELANVQQKLFDISQQTTTDFKANAEIYAQLSAGAHQYGASTQEVLNVTNTLAMAMNAMGKSSDETKGAVQQLAKSLASGEVGGRALVAVFQQIPLVAQALADKLTGGVVASLNEAAAAGRITGRDIIRALQDSALIAKASADKVDTLADGWGNVKNALVQYLGSANTGLGVTVVLTNAFISLATHLGTVLNVLTLMAAVFLSYQIAVLAASVATAVYETVLGVLIATGTVGAVTINGLNVSLTFTQFAAGLASVALGGLIGVMSALWTIIAANPLTSIFVILSGLVTLVSLFGQQIKLTADGTVTAFGAMMGVFNLFKAGLTIIAASLQSMLSWLFQTKDGFAVLTTEAGIAGTFLAVVFGPQIVMGVVIPALTSLISVLARVAAALSSLLLNPLGLTVTAFIAAAVAVAYYTGTLDTLIAKAGELASKMGATVTKAMKDATTAANGASAANQKLAGDMLKTGGASQTAAGGMRSVAQVLQDNASAADISFKAYQDGIARTQSASRDMFSAMGNDAAAAGVVINEAFSFAANDPNAGLLAYIQRTKEAEEASARFTAAMMRDSMQREAQLKKEADEAYAAANAEGIRWSKATYASDQATPHLIENANTVSAAYQKMGDTAAKATTQMATFWATGSGQAPNMGRTTDTLTLLTQAGRLIRLGQEGLVRQLAASLSANDQAYLALVNPGLFKALIPYGLKNTPDKASPPAASTSPNDLAAKALTGTGFASGGSFLVGGAGGTDSQLVSFMASPNERVTVDTPAQARDARAPARGKPVNIYMTVVTPDAQSFKRSERQISQSLLSKLGRASST